MNQDRNEATPADEEWPEDYEDWPEGGPHFARLMRRDIPGLTFGQIRPFVDRMYGADRLTFWKPLPGQDARAVLDEEGGVIAMMVQAWSNRAESVMVDASDPLLRACVTAVRIIKLALRYLPGARHD